MLEGKRILVVVPARGGSKGIPSKNLRPVGGVPLVARVGQVVKRLPMIDRCVVSTDHPEIARVAQGAGIDAPFVRPAELSGDRIADVRVLIHALRETEKLDRVSYDIIVMLQPTSPMRKPSHVLQAIRKLVREKLDSVWTVSETDSKNHPLKQLRIKGKKLEYYDPKSAEVVSRQQLEVLYHRNGVAYAMTRGSLLGQKSIKGKKSAALIVREEVVNIDTWRDLKRAELLWKEKER